ncbi:hypothetical protein DHW03_12750 [Pedobacter yonginense]|uniref:Uncharacterized protein n=1 Tax=Pedobacter yonginense TaxID=651869 RepID=A0A317ELH9_9SPHI|nr:hypothetical protein [Pedobacter yonginense]PWS26889.1 hypothetical protein DHW03_12750 [Pedobacter yonginense]
MRILKALLADFAGAAALNILHETVRRFDKDAPKVHRIGEEALSKSLHKMNLSAPTGDHLYLATLASDLVSNSLYFSAIGYGKDKNVYLKGALAGLTAGFGAISLPSKLGLDDAPVTRTDKTKILTVSWYLIGGLVTAAVLNRLNKD